MDQRIKASRKQEQRIADAFGGRVTPRSGAGWVKKGDVRTDIEYIEAKTTSSNSFSMKLFDLFLAYHEALRCGKRMVFAVEMANGERTGVYNYDYVVLTEEDYLELTRKAGER